MRRRSGGIHIVSGLHQHGAFTSLCVCVFSSAAGAMGQAGSALLMRRLDLGPLFGCMRLSSLVLGLVCATAARVCDEGYACDGGA